ncbi:energy-coupling factor transporter transmembrane component T [uncultured Thermanaerothrix sp.]|uniref:energy-coupling factor transporter transmembrane component T family protein n=1 Tax=uncultured Thermanaerothrix sp. TaxID=1195149 RepID=UPI00262B5058|nr:energy-coupling factor transporter transmembrane component T [uncultured Thermanaerothrix sp.]
MLVTWRYRPRKSLIQSFDPRAWIIFFLCYIACTVLFWDLRYLLVLFGMALVAVFTSGIKWHEMRRAWLFIGGFIFFFSFLTLLTGRGGIELYKEEHVIHRLAAGFTLFGWRPTLVLSAERIAYAVAMMVRVFSLASMTILIPYSLNPALYGVTFRGLGLPDKVAYGMDLTMRFIPSFGRDFQLTLDAQRARGYELEKISGGLFAQVRKLAPLIVPVTIHAIVASEDIIDAMDLRAFGVGPRTWVDELHYRPRDRALIAFGVAMLLCSIALSLWGFGKFWVPEFLLQLAQ